MGEASELRVATGDGVRIAMDVAGDGPPVVLAHGLTATRRYVLMGSRALERSGHHVIAYDARGHGRSSPAPIPSGYSYELLANDLLGVLDALGIERAAIAGVSMGAHTAVRLALACPERVAALALITPAYDPEASLPADAYAGWDRLAQGLREGGVEGFVRAYPLDTVPERWRETVLKVIRQRLAAHEHPAAVADALQAIPRSRPFETIDQLGGIAVPTTVIASRDEADPGHPLAVAERYQAAIPGAALLVEEPGQSPLAWQGGRLSGAIAELVRRAQSSPAEGS